MFADLVSPCVVDTSKTSVTSSILVTHDQILLPLFRDFSNSEGSNKMVYRVTVSTPVLVTKVNRKTLHTLSFLSSPSNSNDKKMSLSWRKKFAVVVLTVIVACTRKSPHTLLLLVQGQAYPEECRNYAPPAILQGNKIFVETTGEYLPIKGINYYPRPNAGDLVLGNSQDFYTEAFRSTWERDIAQFRALNINAIRLYAVDPGQNHDAFMCALKAAGIYVLVGLAADCQNCAVQWQDPPECYPNSLKQRGQFIIQQFAKYENVLAFSAGNEVALSAASALGNVPCQKKFIRDMKAFVQSCNTMRQIPVGLEFADNERQVKAEYYNCITTTNDPLEVADYLGINAYLHCDGTATSIDDLIGWRTLLAGVQQWGITLPFMWTEFGCLNDGFPTIDGYQAQRNFLQVQALFSEQYRQSFVGGFVFEYSTERVYSEQTSPWPFTSFGFGNYGVGYFSPENCNDVDVPCEYVRFPQFQNLADQYAAVDTSSEPTFSEYNPPANPVLPTCPDRFPSLAEFTWPTDSMPDLACPEPVPVFCAGVPAECVTVPFPTPSETGAPTPLAISDRPTQSPTTSLTDTPTKRPSTTPTMVLTETPTTNRSTPSPTQTSITGTPTTNAPSFVPATSRPTTFPSQPAVLEASTSSPDTGNADTKMPASATEFPSSTPSGPTDGQQTPVSTATPSIDETTTFQPTIIGLRGNSGLEEESRAKGFALQISTVIIGLMLYLNL